MKVRLTTLESLQLAIAALLLAATIALSDALCRWIARFQARKLRKLEHDTLFADIEMWLEVQRGQG